ncbi:MAG TPA: hypothetical protein VIU62_20555 [Chloroflexota bacterium]|jgi:hypothetical protein
MLTAHDWRRQADLALVAGLPCELKPYSDAIAEGYGGGRAIPIQRAAVQIAGLTAEGGTLGDYYVYVERSKEESNERVVVGGKQEGV